MNINLPLLHEWNSLYYVVGLLNETYPESEKPLAEFIGEQLSYAVIGKIIEKERGLSS